MLGKEGDSMLTSLNALLDVVDLGVLADEVGLTQFKSLVLLLIFIVLDDFHEIFVLDLAVLIFFMFIIVFTLLIITFITVLMFWVVLITMVHVVLLVVVFHVRVHLLDRVSVHIHHHVLFAGTVLLAALHGRQLGRVYHTSRRLLVLVSRLR